MQNWFEHFKTVFQDNHDIDHTFDEEYELQLRNNHDVHIPDVNCDTLNNEISPSEVIQEIKNMKNNKASGIDGIPSEFFKMSVTQLSPTLCLIFNSVFNSGYFPEQWSKGLIIPIHKKGDRADPKNYRGISLLTIFSKIFTGILNKRLTSWCKINNIIPECQAGFRKGYSTIDSIFVLHSIIQKRLIKKGAKCYCLFVDFSRAFDNVPRAKLLYKLMSIGIHG